jgi:hypothetical protein
MFRSFIEGFKKGYLGKDYVPKAQSNSGSSNSVAQFLGAWQKVCDSSQRSSQEMMRDPRWAQHFRVLDWIITIAILCLILYVILQ